MTEQKHAQMVGVHLENCTIYNPVFFLSQPNKLDFSIYKIPGDLETQATSLENKGRDQNLQSSSSGVVQPLYTSHNN